MPISGRIILAVARLLLIAAAIIFPIAFIVLSLFVDDAAGKRFFILYVAPLFAAAPLWVITRLREYGFRLWVRTALDTTVLVLSFARFVYGDILPFSGHTLFLTYSALTTSATWYRWLAFVLFAETTWFKLVLWNDPATWAVGMALGTAATAILLSNRVTSAT